MSAHRIIHLSVLALATAAGDATAGQAQTDLTTAYTAAAGTVCNVGLFVMSRF